MSRDDGSEHSNFRITLQYDGRHYFGWQRHKDKPTVQGTVESALGTCFGGTPGVQAAGRTDRGVHACGQVISVRLPSELDPATVRDALGEALPRDIQVRDIQRAPADFHARTWAIGKCYRYEIFVGDSCPSELVGRVWHAKVALDPVPMRRACQLFVGTHDFASFASKSNFTPKSTVRTVTSFVLAGQLPRIRLTIVADGFLYKMVRNIVRAVAKVGEGRQTVAALEEVLRAKDRSKAVGTAPASGLYLDEVMYSDELGTDG